MARCDHCGDLVLVGGLRDNERRYCGEDCRGQHAFQMRCDALPESTVHLRLRELRQEPCPRCQGSGPLDIHFVHWVWSAVLFTRWGKAPQFTCRSCATKRQLGGILSCVALGWWGVPWGPLVTPLQTYRNVMAIVKSRDPSRVSPELEQLAREHLAREQVIAEHPRGANG